jgi:transposase InsO family protein
MVAEWAYATIYGSSNERASALSAWLERYNTSRQHGALGHRPPLARLKEPQGNNVAGTYT